MTYQVYFTSAGIPAAGLSVTWDSFVKESDGTSAVQPSFSAVSTTGWYKFDFTPDEVYLGVIDGSSSLSDTDRYVPAKFTVNDFALNSSITSRSTSAIVDQIRADVSGIGGAAMRGTDNATTSGDLISLATSAQSDTINTTIVGISANVDSLNTNVLAVSAVVNSVDTAVAALNNLSTSDIYTVLGLNVSGTIDEIATLPKNPTMAQSLMITYLQRRNKQVTDSNTGKVETYNDAGVKLFDADVSDDGSVFTKGQLS